MKPEEGNTGVEMYPHNPNSAESLLTAKLKDVSHGWFNDQRAIVLEAMEDYSNQQNAALIAALKELIVIAEDLAFIVKENRDNYWMDDKIEKYKSAIENAKLLSDG
jgi:hypothetical protein